MKIKQIGGYWTQPYKQLKDADFWTHCAETTMSGQTSSNDHYQGGEIEVMDG